MVVLVAGTLVVGTGALVLWLAFRRAHRGLDMRLIVGLVAFVFVCCLVMFALSYRLP